MEKTLKGTQKICFNGNTSKPLHVAGKGIQLVNPAWLIKFEKSSRKVSKLRCGLDVVEVKKCIAGRDGLVKLCVE